MAINVKDCAKEGAMKNFGVIRKDSAPKARVKSAPKKRGGSKY